MEFYLLYFGLILICISRICHGSWGTPGLGQYHIQTDEGPERYFRYQTDSGQYRKEKRLQDGTVIGTDAWIDASGFLRQKDYIADNRGYRILKSKTIYVGKGRPIEEAMKSVKNLPAQAGTLVKHNSQSITNYNRPSTYGLYSTPITSTAIPTSSTIPTTNLPSSPYLGYNRYSTPKVFIRHNSQPYDGETYYSPFGVSTTTPIPPTSTDRYYPTTTSSPPITVPVRHYEPPFENKLPSSSVYPVSTTTSLSPDYRGPIAGYPVTSTASPAVSTTVLPYSSTPYSTSSSVPVSSTFNPVTNTYTSDDRRFEPISSTTLRPPYIESATPRPIIPLGGNDLDAQPLYGRPFASSQSPRRSIPYRPTYADGKPQYNNYLGNGYDPQYALYDGVSVTNNGFRYYLPRQYHEEDNHDPNRSTGSFGYVDPFGIRRVIYYNASPENGFVHRKNNRYVGFNATPYDPRPL